MKEVDEVYNSYVSKQTTEKFTHWENVNNGKKQWKFWLEQDSNLGPPYIKGGINKI